MWFNLSVYMQTYSNSASLPAFGCPESPDNRLKSSKAEAAEVGAEETEETALLTAGGADAPEIREQPRRESSAVSGSEEEEENQG